MINSLGIGTLSTLATISRIVEISLKTGMTTESFMGDLPVADGLSRGSQQAEYHYKWPAVRAFSRKSGEAQT
jgi:hypothetical protein